MKPTSCRSVSTNPYLYGASMLHSTMLLQSPLFSSPSSNLVALFKLSHLSDTNEGCPADDLYASTQFHFIAGCPLPHVHARPHGSENSSQYAVQSSNMNFPSLFMRL